MSTQGHSGLSSRCGPRMLRRDSLGIVQDAKDFLQGSGSLKSPQRSGKQGTSDSAARLECEKAEVAPPRHLPSLSDRPIYGEGGALGSAPPTRAVEKAALSPGRLKSPPHTGPPRQRRRKTSRSPVRTRPRLNSLNSSILQSSSGPSVVTIDSPIPMRMCSLESGVPGLTNLPLPQRTLAEDATDEVADLSPPYAPRHHAPCLHSMGPNGSPCISQNEQLSKGAGVLAEPAEAFAVESQLPELHSPAALSDSVRSRADLAQGTAASTHQEFQAVDFSLDQSVVLYAPETSNGITADNNSEGLLPCRSDFDYWDKAEEDSLHIMNFSINGENSHSQMPMLSTGVASSFSSFSSQRPLQTMEHESSHLEESAAFSDVEPAGCVRGEQFLWVRGELIGRGTLGSVHKALNQRTGEMMAVKEVSLDCKDKKEEQLLKSLQNEIDLYKELHHPNIVSYLGHDYNVAEGRLFIYLEFMPGGSISQILSTFGPLDESLAASYVNGLLMGLHYLHTREPPILHRDIKGANILVGLDREVKLSDFGCSKRSSGTAIHTLRGSIPWMAPEVMQQQSGYGRKADIWSLGCVLIEMLTAAQPWGTFDNSLAAMVRIAMSDETPPVPEHASGPCQDFIIQCTQRVSKDRPDAVILLEHDFVTAPNRSVTDESWD